MQILNVCHDRNHASFAKLDVFVEIVARGARCKLFVGSMSQLRHPSIGNVNLPTLRFHCYSPQSRARGIAVLVPQYPYKQLLVLDTEPPLPFDVSCWERIRPHQIRPLLQRLHPGFHRV